MTALWIGTGLLLLFVGGELLVRGAVSLAQRLGVSKALIGATVVGFGTSAPELAVALDAAGRGHGELTLGTIVGSNLCNVLLILPIAALIHPVRWSRSAVRADAATLALASLLFGAIAATGGIGRSSGLVLVLALASITALAIVRDRRTAQVTVDLLAEEAAGLARPATTLLGAALWTLAGLGGVALGAEWLVHGATAAARSLGVSEATIGLTMVAVGTSLPELAAGAAAARRQHSEVALGNVIGSNVFNQLGIVGTAALLSPLAVPTEVARFDLWAMLAVMAAASAGLVVFSRLGRPAAMVGLFAYAAWIATKA